ncbi:MAG: pyridoxal-phosphate dependent enzyme [Acidobacteria bacterium]|nr:pyridoxal-phosphate dependent enzyme [Acidobacteriota bacterium]
MQEDKTEPPSRPVAVPPPAPETNGSRNQDIATDLSLLDGAAAPSTPFELETRKRIAADRSVPLVERLEAFEDIIESDVGDTTLSRARNIEREVGLRQIYLKFEGDNPSGTHKDRIAFAQARDAMRRGFDVITMATCGNYGASIATAASLAGLRCVIYIPENYQTRRLQEMGQHGAEVVRVPGDYETAVQVSRERAEKDEFYDANPGGANTDLQLQVYGEIAYEIYDDLRDAPAVVAVPVSNGTTLAGIYRGFLSLYRRGRTSKLPRLVAGSSHRKNPIIEAFRNGWKRCEDLDPKKIKETPVNEPLINWRALDGDYALAAVQQTGGWAGDATDRDLMYHSRLIRDKQGLHILPAATASLAVLLERHRQEPLPGDRYVVVLTGRRP